MLAGEVIGVRLVANHIRHGTHKSCDAHGHQNEAISFHNGNGKWEDYCINCLNDGIKLSSMKPLKSIKPE